MISFDRIQKQFPEAKLGSGGDHAECYINCPKPHKGGGVYQLTINMSSGAFVCHNCGYKGNAETELVGPLVDALRRLQVSRDNGVVIEPSPQRFVAKTDEITWGSAKFRAPGETVPVTTLPPNHPAVLYLQQRGFDMSEHGPGQAFPVLYCTKGYFRTMKGLCQTKGRIVFPVVMSGDIVGWQARVVDRMEDDRRFVWHDPNWVEMKRVMGRFVDADVPKYYTCPGMQRSTAIYNFDGARKHRHVVVTEGVLDAIRVGPEAIATFGKIITANQVRLLKAYWDTVIILRDSDVDPSDIRFQQTLRELSCLNVVHFSLCGYQDPGSAPRATIWDQIANNIDLNRQQPAPNPN